MGGSVNKDHTDYAPVKLRQQKDEWQSDGLKASLVGVFGEVAGTGPKAAGQAWVEFDAARNVAVLHYDDGSGNSGSGSAGSGEEGGGGTVAPTPTNPTKPIEPTSPTEPETTPDGSSEDVKPSKTSPFGGTAYDWDTDVKNQAQCDIKKGRVYTSNGNTYIGTRDRQITDGERADVTLDVLTGWWCVAKFTGTIKDISEFISWNTPVTRGDVCKVGNDYYVFSDGGDASKGPLEESWRWQIIEK